MRALIQEISHCPGPEILAAAFQGEPGLMLLHSALREDSSARYSFLVARPMLAFRSFGSRCLVNDGESDQLMFGNPWQILGALLARFELADQPDCPFPLGGCFGYWGYGLKNFCEPRLNRRSADDLELPECCVGFYPSLMVVDHHLQKSWLVATGLRPDGSSDAAMARQQADVWRQRLAGAGHSTGEHVIPPAATQVHSSMSRASFIAAVQTAQRYIRSGDIYQVNLSHRLSARLPAPLTPWGFHQRLTAISPAPFAAWMDGGDFQVSASSPELFLRLCGNRVVTRPIKGTRPRGENPTQDAQLMYELQTSPKEMAELVMITDLLRNDLGRVCEFGSVQVPDLARLERFAQVQHLVSTVEGQLRPELTHLDALAACFPGGSITGAPKIRAMEIIDELEPVARGLYTGCLGYLGFNRESQLNMIIRTAVCHQNQIHFSVGAGIVADSDPAAEYAETLAKAGGFLSALQFHPGVEISHRHACA
jgi:para-aminobenzoate synthetase component 1